MMEMTEKRFYISSDSNQNIYDAEKKCYYSSIDAKKLCELLNVLHEENVELKNSLKEFEVFKSNRIKGAVVTNDDFSVTLHSNNEAYMVCNMLNRFIGSVKNGSKN